MCVRLRKFKNQATRLIRNIRLRVKPVDETWAELEALRHEIVRSWRSDKTAVQLVSEQRR